MQIQIGEVEHGLALVEARRRLPGTTKKPDVGAR